MNTTAALSDPRFRWSVLPPVPLRGVSTALVESVEHYASRLAWTTGVNLKRLCALPPPFDEPGQRAPGGTSRFCGPGQTYKRRIQNLEALTGVDTLHCGSFLVLDELLAKGAIGRRSTRHRWCPQCFLEWNDATSWEPLIWQVDLLATCPIHGCELICNCWKCYSIQHVSTAYERRRQCRRCGASLGYPGQTKQQPGYHRWAQHQLCELICLCATPGQSAVRASAYETFVEGLASLSLRKHPMPWPVKAAIARVKTTPRRNRASLQTLINLCALQGVPIVEMLIDPVVASSRPLLDLWSGYRSMEFLPEHHAAKISAYNECLAEVLQRCKDLYLPSMRFLLREIKLNRDLARELSVDLYEAYEEAHRRQGPQSRLMHAERAFRHAMGIFKAPGFDPFARYDMRRAARRVASVANVSSELAKRIARAALLCQRALVRVKAELSARSHS